MVSSRENQFGKLPRERRRLLNLTQEELAGRIRVSMPFVGHLETGHRRPSEKTIAKLAKVLRLDQQELFILANPRTRDFLRALPQDSQTAQRGISSNETASQILPGFFDSSATLSRLRIELSKAC